MLLVETKTTIDAKRIPWRMRPDLRSVSLDFNGLPSWGIKDPLNLAYFELSDEAFFVLNQLNGRKTSDELCRGFHDRFRPRTLSSEELHGFVRQLVSQNLVVAELPGQGRNLVAQQRAMRPRQRLMKLSNLLAIRFRGFDPDRLFGAMLLWMGWLFSPLALMIELSLILSAATLVTVHFDQLLTRLPATQALLSAPNVVWLSLLLATVKVLHEFGHGLTCKRFGGECHEMGIMLLVFTPTLYCNVSDIWMLKNKWQRIAVSLAGMWVEAVIAAACTLLWWFSAPGLFNSLCFNLIFLCGVSTLVFNGNPLMRYDGYFVLSDWLEIPNLQQQAMAAVGNRLAVWFCGFDATEANESLPHRQWGLFAYGVASTSYRVVLTFLILWGLHRWLNPLGLGVVVQLFAILSIGTIVMTPMATLVKFLRDPENRAQIHWPQFWSRSSAALVGLLLLLYIPLPCRVTAGALAEDNEAQRVYVTFPGTLIEAVRIGQQVEQGQVIARLEEPRLKVALTQLEGELKQQRARLEQLERRRVGEPNIGQLIPTVRESVRDFEQQLDQRRHDAERLVLRSSRTGTILSAPHQSGGMKSGSLAGWMGSPIDERNRGCFLRAGTTLCWVGSDHSPSAQMIINQDDINLVRVGQRVRLLWNELSGEIQEGKIVELAGFDLDSLSREAVIRLNLPARITPNGLIRPVGTWYQARVTLDETTSPLLHGSAGVAKIVVEPQSLGSRLLRWLKRTFPM
jgi:putative peptide zinc metalloprotease protein